MKRTLLMLTLGCSVSTGAEAEDHLAPCSDFLEEYESRVDAIAQKETPGTVEFRVTVIPAFTPESSVAISTESGRYFVTHVVFDRLLWHSINDPSKGEVRATAKTAGISAELYRALRPEWDRSIETARPANRLVNDGVVFTFRSDSLSARSEVPLLAQLAELPPID